jgi:hypothetical protein
MHCWVGAFKSNASVPTDRGEPKHLAVAPNQIRILLKGGHRSTETRLEVELIVSKHHRVRGLYQSTRKAESIRQRRDNMAISDSWVGLNR